MHGLWSLLLLASGALADPSEAGPRAPDAGETDLVARRTRRPVAVDGRLDELAWGEAPVFARFVESFPSEGAPASLRTEARILYDDEFLYLGVKCFDPSPEAIARQLGRRDSSPAADKVELALDSTLDRRTAYHFTVNAAGVLHDELLSSDVDYDESWDAVWDGASALLPDGWSAELAIPLRVLRFSEAKEQVWGIALRRTVTRSHQVFDSRLIPRSANPVYPGRLVVSRFGRLGGLEELKPRVSVELLPYAAARAQWRPQLSDPSRPTPRLSDASADLGLDFKVALSSQLNLTGAVNPDFGQVEADQIMQNTSTSELYYPEKRPLFLQGLDIFKPIGNEYTSTQNLFYSRRIGLTAPILGAVKLTGALRPGLSIGLFDAVVMGAGNPSMVPLGYGPADGAALASREEHPDRRWQFHPSQPFHFGPNDALPAAHPVSINYLAAVARQQLGERATVGAILAAATPLGPRCLEREFATRADYEAAGCESMGGNAFALDWNARDRTGEWRFFGQLEASQQIGGPPGGRLLRDGTTMRPGDLGFGGHLRAGKIGGEPFRFDVVYAYQSAKLDLNAMGYQPLSDVQKAVLNLHYVRPSGIGGLRSFSVDYDLDVRSSAGGGWIPRGVFSVLQSKIELPTYDAATLRFGLELPQYDSREISGSGVAFERARDVFVDFIVESDPNRKLVLIANPYAGRGWGPSPSQAAVIGLFLQATWRPVEPLETFLEVNWARKSIGPRWLETRDDQTAVFSEQRPAFLSITLRQQWVLAPPLTAQVYAQLYSEALQYGQFYGASLAGRDRLPISDLLRTDPGADPSTHASVLNLNAVLRWEYRLGSTLYAVYTRSQSELPAASGQKVSANELPSRLFKGPATDSFMVKWSRLWNL